MTTIIQNSAVRTIELGIAVSRATNTLPASTAGNIFTVSGGRIILISLVGEVTTVIQTQACTLKVSTAPTTGSAVDLCAASASISAAAVGTHFTLPAAAATALVTDLSTGGGVIAKQAAWLIPAGAISITTSATNTGSVKWDLAYVPLDVGASVAAA